jgi:hypothetical protein
MMTKIRLLLRARIASGHAVPGIAAVAAIVGSTLMFSVQNMAARQQTDLSPETVVAENSATTAPPTGGGSAKPTPLHPCTRVCVKSKPGGPASPGECLQWKTVC